jgi:hypothetical protein
MNEYHVTMLKDTNKEYTERNSCKIKNQSVQNLIIFGIQYKKIN